MDTQEQRFYQENMKCPICKPRKTANGNATLILERDKTALIFKHVSAEFFNSVKQAVEVGAHVDAKEYLAA